MKDVAMTSSVLAPQQRKKRGVESGPRDSEPARFLHELSVDFHLDQTWGSGKPGLDRGNVAPCGPMYEASAK